LRFFTCGLFACGPLMVDPLGGLDQVAAERVLPCALRQDRLSRQRLTHQERKLLRKQTVKSYRQQLADLKAENIELKRTLERVISTKLDEGNIQQRGELLKDSLRMHGLTDAINGSHEHNFGKALSRAKTKLTDKGSVDRIKATKAHGDIARHGAFTNVLQQSGHIDVDDKSNVELCIDADSEPSAEAESGLGSQRSTESAAVFDMAAGDSYNDSVDNSRAEAADVLDRFADNILSLTNAFMKLAAAIGASGILNDEVDDVTCAGCDEDVDGMGHADPVRMPNDAAFNCHLKLFAFQCAFREAMLAQEDYDWDPAITRGCLPFTILDEHQDVDECDYFRLSRHVEYWEQCRFLQHFSPFFSTGGRISRAVTADALRGYAQAQGEDGGLRVRRQAVDRHRLRPWDMGFLAFVCLLSDFDAQYANIHTKYDLR